MKGKYPMLGSDFFSKNMIVVKKSEHPEGNFFIKTVFYIIGNDP
jgi:hypothetical protein